MTELWGETDFYSETGTEGGYWAFFDTSHERLEPPTYGVFPNRDVWDADAPERHGMTRAPVAHLDGRELPDPIQKDPDYEASSLFRGQNGGDRDADRRLMERYGFAMVYADNTWGGTPMTEPRRPWGIGPGDVVTCSVEWDDGELEEGRLSDTLLVKHRSYEGLHVLRSGDRLTVYDRDAPDDPDGVLWEGEVRLRDCHTFSEDTFGMWVHSQPAEEMGVSERFWGQLFMRSHPARLVRAEEPLANEPAPPLPPVPWWQGSHRWDGPLGFFHEEIFDSIRGNPEAGYHRGDVGWFVPGRNFGVHFAASRMKVPFGDEGRWRFEASLELGRRGVDVEWGRRGFRYAFPRYERRPGGGTVKDGGL